MTTVANGDNAAPATASKSVDSARWRYGPALFRAMALGLVMLGAWAAREATGMVYYTPVGPGPGFFPFWLGMLLAVLGGTILIASVFGSLPELESGLVPHGAPSLRMAATLAAVAAFALLVERLGFVLTMFAVLLGLLRLNGVRRWSTVIPMALGGSLGIGYAFSEWLSVFLPPAPYGLLAAIGL